jgi:hypothetical protein
MLQLKGWGRRGHDRMVVGFTTTYAISTYHHWCYEFESRSGRGVQHYVIKFNILKPMLTALLIICIMFLWLFVFVCLMVFNATFNNISVISWRSVLLVEETTDLSQVTDKLYHTNKPLVEQERFTIPEHMSWPPSLVRVVQICSFLCSILSTMFVFLSFFFWPLHASHWQTLSYNCIPRPDRDSNSQHQWW